MVDIHGLTADEIATKSMKIAADLCVYSNHNTIKEILIREPPTKPEDASLQIKGSCPNSVQLLLKYLNQPFEPQEGDHFELTDAEESELSVQEEITALKYLCGKYMPQLLGRSARDFVMIERCVELLKANDAEKLKEMLSDK